MGKTIYTFLNTVKLVDVLVTSALLIIVIGFLLTQRKHLQAWLDNWRKKRNFEDTIMKVVEQNTNKIDYLEDTMIQARETSKDIRAEMYDDLKEVSDDVKKLVKTVETMQEDNRVSKMKEARAEIAEIFRRCKDIKKITDTDLKVLEDHIEEYEKYGGINSFVHTLVIPSMYTWEVIETPLSNDTKN